MCPLPSRACARVTWFPPPAAAEAGRGCQPMRTEHFPPSSPACAVTSQFGCPLRILAPHRLRFTNVKRCHHYLKQYKREARKILLSSWQILHILIPGLREVVSFVYIVEWSFSQVVLNICMGCPLLCKSEFQSSGAEHMHGVSMFFLLFYCS